MEPPFYDPDKVAIARVATASPWSARSAAPGFEPDPALGVGNDGQEFWEYLDTLRRRAPSILGLAAAFALVGWLICLPQTPLYRARTSLEFQLADEPSLRNGDPSMAPRAVVNEGDLLTEVTILQSEALADRVVRALHLDERQEADSPSSPWVRLWQTASPATADADVHQAAVNSLMANTRVRPIGQTHIIEILYDSHDPRRAAEVANTLAQEYFAREQQLRSSTSAETNEYLSSQLELLRTRLERSQSSLQEYAHDNNLTLSSDRVTAHEQNLHQLREELAKAKTDRLAKQAEYMTALTRPIDTLPEVLDNGVLNQYQLRMTELTHEITGLESTLTPAHYKVQRARAQLAELQAQIDRVRENILKRISNDLQSARSHEGLLAAAYAEQAAKVSDETSKLTRYDLLKREYDSTRQLYEATLQKVNESRITSALQPSAMHVVDRAGPPARPYTPNAPLNASLGFLIGLSIGTVFVFVREGADYKLRTPSGARRYLAMRELGVIPGATILSPRGWLRKRPDDASSAPEGSSRRLVPAPVDRGARAGRSLVELLTWQHKPSLVAESFRSTLASILFSAESIRPQVIAITSPGQAEGKTTVVSNLGIAISEVYQPTLIIDADQRKPRLHDIFDVANTWGLSNVLGDGTNFENCPLESLARPTEIPGLFVLPSGPRVVNSSNLFYSDRLAALFKRLRREFKMVLIDTPPTMPLPDARVISRLADGTVLVIRAGQTSRASALMARGRLEADGTPLLGIVVNDYCPRGTADDYSIEVDGGAQTSFLGM